MADLDAVGVLTSVSVTSTSTPVLPPNPLRQGATITNSGGNAVYLALGFTPTSSLYSIAIATSGYYELPFNWTGAINAITASASSTLLVTELT